MSSEREDIERIVRIEEELRSHDKQIDSLRKDRHRHGNWLQKQELTTSSHATSIHDMREEQRRLNVTVEALEESISVLTTKITVEKVKIALILAGIGGFTGIISSVVTAVIMSKLLG